LVNLDCSSHQTKALKEVLCCPIAGQRPGINTDAPKRFGVVDRVLHQRKPDADSSRFGMNPQIIDSSEQIAISESFVGKDAVADESLVDEANPDSHVVVLEVVAKSLSDRLATTS
jgi:hypothetical protein